MKPVITCRDIECCVATHFGYRQNIIVPNVSWGLFARMEVDLLVIRPSMWAIEVEIKTSRGDIIKDLTKGHGHKSKLLKQTWFAVPEHLAATPEIPQRFGVLAICDVKRDDGSLSYRIAKPVRVAANNKDARKLTPSEIETVARLGCMRIWDLKNSLTGALNSMEYYRKKVREQL